MNQSDTRLSRLPSTCGLIVVFSAPLGCFYEAAQQPHIVEVELKDDSIHTLAATPGPMHAGERLRKAKLKGENLRQAMLAGAELTGDHLVLQRVSAPN